MHPQVIMILLKNAGSTWICPWHVDNATSFPRSLSSAPCWKPTAKGTDACPGNRLPFVVQTIENNWWKHLPAWSRCLSGLPEVIWKCFDKHQATLEVTTNVLKMFSFNQAGLECRSNEGHLPYFCWDCILLRLPQENYHKFLRNSWEPLWAPSWGVPHVLVSHSQPFISRNSIPWATCQWVSHRFSLPGRLGNGHSTTGTKIPGVAFPELRMI
jgi:hypothetical protein